MPPLRPRLLLACAALTAAGLLAAADAPPAGAKYRPQIAPHFSAGQIFSYSATAVFNSAMRIGGKTRNPHTNEVKVEIPYDNQENFYVELVADNALARQVFKNGSLSEAEFLVTRCRLVDATGQPHELLPANTILGARKQKDGQIAFAVNGRTPDPALAMRLSVLIPMGDERNTNNDLLMPAAAKAAGESWPVNEKAVINSELANLFPGVDGVAGGVKFVKVLTEQPGSPRGIISAEYTLGDVRPPFPPGVDARASLVSFQVQAAVPLTPGPGQYDLKLNAQVIHGGQTGDVNSGMSETDVDFGVNLEQTVHYTLGDSRAAPPALARAPVEPDAPPLAPNMSSAPFLRPPPKEKSSTVKAEAQPGAAPAPAAAAPTAPAAPPAPLAPLHTPAPGSLNPFTGAQALPSAPKDTAKSN